MTRGELEDERSFLLSSLEDLDREYEAGDLSDQDHEMLRDGYIARAAEVIRALDDGPRPAVPPSAPSYGTRRQTVRNRRILIAAMRSW
jgi:hypothetical protein